MVELEARLNAAHEAGRTSILLQVKRAIEARFVTLKLFKGY